MNEFLPITVDEVHEVQIDCLIISGKMLQNFGPWKLNEYKVLTFNFDNGSVVEYNDEGIAINKINIKLEERKLSDA